MSCWLFFTVIMVAAYTGNLFSFITFPSLLAPIDSLQVYQLNVKFHSQGKSYMIVKTWANRSGHK
jgi:hypothetical protein